MTLNQFVAQNTGKKIADPQGLYPGECVSLWKDYFVQNKGIPYADLFVPNSGGAKYIWYATTPAMLKWFDKIPTSEAPQPGDTVVYDGSYGDVALYIGNGQVFGQLGTPVFKPAAIRPIGGPIGFLRYKKGELMIGDDPNDIYSLRIVMSEVEGWNGNDIHSGKDDSVIMGAWKGHSWQELIFHCWTVQPTHRQTLTDTIASLQAAQVYETAPQLYIKKG